MCGIYKSFYFSLVCHDAVLWYEVLGRKTVGRYGVQIICSDGRL